MITISLISAGIFILKFMAVVISMLFGGMIILWPINDKPVSKTQKAIFAVFSVSVAAMIFGVIQFTI